MSVRSEDFAGRVKLAVDYISNGRKTSRTFDSCFEEFDGDLVAVAIYRRAEKNSKLAANLPKYLCQTIKDETLAKYAHVPTKHLAAEARKMREAAYLRNNIS